LIHYVIKHNKVQAANTHRFKQAVTEHINIKHEYKPLMCTNTNLRLSIHQKRILS